MEFHYREYYRPEVAEYDPLTEKRYHFILNRLERGRGPGRLLDVGCGAGHFLAVAQGRGWQATGLEVSQSALKILRRVKAERQLKFSVIECPLTEAQLPSGSFDVVTLFEVIEHLDDPSAVLKESRRLLTEGGILFLTTPNYDSLSRILLNKQWRILAKEHRCLLNRRAIRHFLEGSGFFPLKVITKNIDIPEILSAWRNEKKDGYSAVSPGSPSQRLRRQVENSPWLRRAKAVVNGLFRFLPLGDTIEVFAIKKGTLCRK